MSTQSATRTQKAPPRATHEPVQWRSRIVGYGEVDPTQLLANPLNWRIHPKVQQDALQGSLEQLGWIQAIIVNRVTNCVVDGHARAALAISAEQKLVPVTYIEITLGEEKLALATYDRITGLAIADAAIYEQLMRDVTTPDPALAQLLDDAAREMGFVPGYDSFAQDQQITKKAETIKEQWLIMVTCTNEAQQLDLLERFAAEGLDTRALSA